MTLERRAVRRQLAGILVVATAMVALSLVVSPEAVLSRVLGVAERPVAFAGVLAMLYLLRPVVAWPVTPLAVVVGYGFGVELGVPVAITGAVLTCLPPFFVARHFRDRAGLVGQVGETGRSLLASTGNTQGILAARLVPIPTDVVTYAAGVSGVPLRALVVGTAVGELPWTVVAVLAGSSMQSFSLANATGTVDWPLMVVAALVAVAIVVGSTYYRKRVQLE